jgi:hypothetical protein
MSGAAMASFQEKFFPSVYEHNQNYEDTDPYCKFNDQMLQLFTSSLFLAGMFCPLIMFPVSWSVRVYVVIDRNGSLK